MDKHAADEVNNVIVVKMLDEVTLTYSLVGEFLNINSAEIGLFLEDIFIVSE